MHGSYSSLFKMMNTFANGSIINVTFQVKQWWVFQVMFAILSVSDTF